MLNKKGFTVAEVIVSFSLVSVILASMIGSTIYYRDKVKEEEVITQLIDFKNTVTKAVYDDIVSLGSRKIVSVNRCIGTSNCVNFVDKNNITHTLKIIEYNTSTNEHRKGVYLSYDGKLYMLPDSDLETNNELVCDFVGGFNIEYDSENNIDLYTIKTAFKHKKLNKQYTIILTLTHYNESN